ncbi:CHAT domain-containing protein [Curtobacterium sp. MCBA15_001]|uniref:CHAT domain-containing protein n=1 Tax=Curtobacterium sp. MCBA15_001 TaxID=1898731 RepID=UPI0009F2FE18|nr:CHAT domain-containing protein [Curtobacterium sp. MCBA15_001]
MERIVVWDRSTEDLGFAEIEVKSIRALHGGSTEVVEVPSSVDWEDLGAFVGSVKPTVFHFIGHGSANGSLALSEDLRRSSSDLIRLVRAAYSGLRGVFLSGCFTANPGPELLAELTPAGGWLVGTTAAVEDELAAQYAGHFYRQLLNVNADPARADQVASAYVVSDWVELPPHRVWVSHSNLPPVSQMAQDIHIALRQILDRPAFKIEMRQEFSLQQVLDALDDVSHALGTGQVRSRRWRTVVDPASFPPEWLQDRAIQKFVGSAHRAIVNVRHALADLDGFLNGADNVGNVVAQLTDKELTAVMELSNKIDHSRNVILKEVNRLLVSRQVLPLPPIPLSFSAQELAAARRLSNGD